MAWRRQLFSRGTGERRGLEGPLGPTFVFRIYQSVAVIISTATIPEVSAALHKNRRKTW